MSRPPLKLTRRGEAVADTLAILCILATLAAFATIFTALGA